MSDTTVNKNLSISAPWVTYYHQVNALFDEDPNVSVVYDEENNVIKLYVDGTDKAEALSRLLPTEKNFGGVSVKVEIIPANKTESIADTLAAAFDGNPNFVEVVEAHSSYGEPTFIYCAFAAKVAQYWNDNLHDLHGNTSTLYEDLAREVIGEEIGVCFCTDEIVKEETE